MKITVNNPSLDGLEMTYLALSYQAGATSIQVRNNQNFADTNKILIGHMGNEKAEVVSVSGTVTPGQTLGVTATLFAHNADDPVYRLKYDKIRFYRSTTGIDGVYNLLSTEDIDVDNSNLSTTYDDVNGLSSYYYKISYYDSVGDVESELSDPIPGSGYERNMVGNVINQFFEEVGDTTQQHMSVTEALGIMNEVNDDLMTASRRPFMWLRKRTTLSTVAGNNRIALPEDTYKIDRISYTLDDGITNRTDNYRIIDMNEMEYINWDNTYGPTDDLLYFAIDEATRELVMYPTPKTTQSDVITIYYYAYPTHITSMSQKLQTPNSRVYKLYLLGKFYRKRSVKESSFAGISDRYMNEYTGELVKMQRSNRIDVGSPTGMRPDTRHSRGLRRY